MTGASSAPAPRRRVLLLAAAAALTAAVYGSGLEISPIYLTKDEASFGIQSHAIATTGRDAMGNRLPLFFIEPGFNIGRDPLYIYASAAVLGFRPLTGGALRVPTTIAAAISVGLIVLIAYELYGSVSLAAAAGVLLAVTPAFFIRSRAALSVSLPVLFQLVWLLFLLRYQQQARPSQIVVSTAALGVGLYSYLAMVFFAPIHFAITCGEVIRQRRWRHLAIAVAVLTIALVPLAAWQVTHPERLGEIIGSYRIYDPNLNPLQGAKDVLSWSSLAHRFDLYWSSLNPSRLFFSGESSLVDSTRAAGLFPVVYLVLLPLGIYEHFKRPVSMATFAVVATFFVAPLPSVMVGSDTIGRYLVIAPLAALLATAGLRRMWQLGRVAARAAAVAAVVISVVLFAGFYRDYMGDWRARSALYFGGNLKGALEHVLAGSPAHAPDLVYISSRIPYSEVYWEFYRRAWNRDDLAGRYRGLTLEHDDWKQGGRDVAIVPGRADSSAQQLKDAGWQMVAAIPEVDGGAPTFYVFAR
jgi:4-amino-4-deoxy-L-arabinose transferase-like glycosyltransferase